MDQSQSAWDDYVEGNPFVRGLSDGTLSHAAFQHFLKQGQSLKKLLRIRRMMMPADYIFLKHYARVYALAAYKSDSFESIKAAMGQSSAVANQSDHANSSA